MTRSLDGKHIKSTNGADVRKNDKNSYISVFAFLGWPIILFFACIASPVLATILSFCGLVLGVVVGIKYKNLLAVLAFVLWSLMFLPFTTSM